MKKVAPIVAALIAPAVLCVSVNIIFIDCAVAEDTPGTENCCGNVASCCGEDCACQINPAPNRDAKESAAPAPSPQRTTALKLAVSTVSTTLFHLARLEAEASASRAGLALVGSRRSLYLLDCIFLL